MHIEHLFCSTYKQSVPITGQIKVKLESGQFVEVKFNDDECAAIQSIAVQAYERSRDELANEITSGSPKLLEIEHSQSLDDEEIPF